jgi:hypothetical protein
MDLSVAEGCRLDCFEFTGFNFGVVLEIVAFRQDGVRT